MQSPQRPGVFEFQTALAVPGGMRTGPRPSVPASSLCFHDQLRTVQPPRLELGTGLVAQALTLRPEHLTNNLALGRPNSLF